MQEIESNANKFILKFINIFRTKDVDFLSFLYCNTTSGINFCMNIILGNLHFEVFHMQSAKMLPQFLLYQQSVYVQDVPLC